jgi:hypothetical protein
VVVVVAVAVVVVVVSVAEVTEAVVCSSNRLFGTVKINHPHPIPTFFTISER